MFLLFWFRIISPRPSVRSRCNFITFFPGENQIFPRTTKHIWRVLDWGGGHEIRSTVCPVLFQYSVVVMVLNTAEASKGCFFNTKNSSIFFFWFAQCFGVSSWAWIQAVKPCILGTLWMEKNMANRHEHVQIGHTRKLRVLVNSVEGTTK